MRAKSSHDLHRGSSFRLARRQLVAKKYDGSGLGRATIEGILELAQTRPAVAADLPRLAELVLETWRRAYAGVVPPRFLADLDVRRIRERWEHHLLVNEFSIVATVQSDVVGVCSGGAIRDAVGVQPTCGEFYSINIDPRYWRRGLGALLLSNGVTSLQASGYRDAALWTMADNRRAKSFYASQGWFRDGGERTTSSLTGSPIHEIRLRCSLQFAETKN